MLTVVSSLPSLVSGYLVKWALLAWNLSPPTSRIMNLSLTEQSEYKDPDNQQFINIRKVVFRSPTYHPLT